ncbi:MAG: fibrobacter succinogenes major paralogous domain-containing protein [Bacteroidales bacterium]|nr:fibrobacter succinogenes major paralogous domain-containing protein [Bacteroidales bacterium]
MKKTVKHITFMGAIALILILGCKKEINLPPDVITHDPTSVTDTLIETGGTVTSSGASAVTKRGVVWDSVTFITYDFSDTNLFGSKKRFTSDGVGDGPYSSTISPLHAGTAYFVRAYAKTEDLTTFGNLIMVSTVPDTINTMIDLDGNVYHTMTYYWLDVLKIVRHSTWTIENLKTTRYATGEEIPIITDSITGDTTRLWKNQISGAYCNYNNDTNNVPVYGNLYNWYAVHSSNRLCPLGWHVPDDEEWQNLLNFLGGQDIAGGKMKEEGFDHWWDPNSEASNTSRFTALPGGGRSGVNGSFNFIGQYGNFWTASPGAGPQTAIGYFLYYNAMHVGHTEGNIKSGLSVRCVKDD